MNKIQMQAILDKIKEYNKIIIFRHFRPDGDAVGSTKGLKRILELSFPEKEIYLINSDYSDYLAFLGGEDTAPDEEIYKDALGIVLDTGNAKRVSNQNFALCKEVIKLDHHIPLESYGNLEWVEEERSSTCEMIAAFYDAFKDELKIDKEAATYIYTGMVTDSGRFRFRDVSAETMRLAGTMLDCGIDTEWIFANLYLKEFDLFEFESYVYKHIKRTKNGVAYIHVTDDMKEKFNLSMENASAVVSYMDSIKGSLVWVAFIDSPDGTIRVRLRSRFMHINSLAEKYRGGGHASAAGATLLEKAEIRKLLREADKMLKNYKENNEGWL